MSAIDVDQKRNVVIVCPNCGFQKEVKIPCGSNSQTVYSVKCKCGKDSDAVLNLPANFLTRRSRRLVFTQKW